MKVALWMLMILSLGAAEAGAQTIADIARQQRETRDQGPRSTRTITTEGAMAMRRTATVSIAGAVQAPETSEAAAPGPAVAERELASPLDTATPDASEATWRAAFEAAREEIRRAEDRIVLGEQELTELNNQLLTRSDIYNREYQLAPMIAAKQQEIAQARDRLVEASQAIEQLQSNLRRAGLPAGWAR